MILKWLQVNIGHEPCDNFLGRPKKKTFKKLAYGADPDGTSKFQRNREGVVVCWWGGGGFVEGVVDRNSSSLHLF